MDILLYSSPVYCQRIIDQVGKEIKRVYELFMCKFPDFKGKVSIAGHSLGSLILFDILCNQVEELQAEHGKNAQASTIPPINVEIVPPSETVLEQGDTNMISNSIHSIESVLSHLNISSENLIQKFKKEEITDLEGLELLSEEDLQGLMVPLGHRKQELTKSVIFRSLSRKS